MTQIPRRRCLAALGAFALASVAPAARAEAGAPRVLRFEHLHTGEKLCVEYFAAGGYLPDALGAVNHLLRDFRTGDVGAIDAALLDQLHELDRLTAGGRPFQVISGYRSPATNQMLRERSGGVASNSLHMRGQAIDIRLAGVPLATLHDAALALRAGGVGYYPASDFVHVDTGRVRAW